MSHDLITGPHGLNSTTCECGRKKLSGNSFCLTCYRALPRSAQLALYRHVGEGYEEAHARARAILKGDD